MNRSGNIGFQGAKGANSEIASRETFPNMTPVPFDTFEDVFNALDAGEIDLAMIPIENTLAGRVADVHHLLPEAGLYIVGEHFLPIRFQLMTLKGGRLDRITDVYSHIHALGQCRRIIREIGARGHVAGDTAGAARQIS